MEIAAKFNQLFEEHIGQKPEADQHLYEQGIDSLDIVELVMVVEEEFDVELPDDQLYGEGDETVGGFPRTKLRLATPAQWIAYIEERRNGKAE